MLCSHCAAELAAGARVCGMCGAAGEEPPFPVLPSLTAESTAEPPPAPNSLPQPPYAAFVSLALGLGLSLSAVALSFSHNLAQGEWRISPWSWPAYPLAVVSMLLMPRTWSRIESISDQLGRDKKLLGRTVIFALLFIVIASVVGGRIGTDGRETGQLMDDYHEVSRIGRRISEARQSVEPNVPAHLAMYKEIEPDVEQLDAVLRKLDAELPNYDDKFPDQHQSTQHTMHSVKVGLKRASLLEQQIAVAREIETLDPAPRWRAWQERMQPLLEAETALDQH